MPRCDLPPGSVVFYEDFDGSVEVKDRYFVVIRNIPPTVTCFTTTTRDHTRAKPHLITEYFEIKVGECCLPKHCFLDFIHPHEFDDIQFGTLLGSKRVQSKGELPRDLLSRLRDALKSSRTLSLVQKNALLASLDLRLSEC